MNLVGRITGFFAEYWIVIAVVALISGCIVFGVVEFPPQ